MPETGNAVTEIFMLQKTQMRQTSENPKILPPKEISS
jgi:hypothetical protein